MRAGAAKKKSGGGRLVTRPIENGKHGEKVVECKLAIENMAASEAVGCFEILGRDDLDAFDQARKIRGVGGERLNDSGAKFPAAGVPIPFSEFIRSILYAGGEDVLAFRGEGRIENRWKYDVALRRFRELDVLGGC